MFRISALLSLLLVSAFAPFAAAAVEPTDVCTPDGNACAVLRPDDRFSWYGVYFYDTNTGTFGDVGYGEGSGFFADTATAVVFVYNPTSGQWVALVLTANDYGRDGDYDDAGVFAGTWNDDASVPAVGEGYSTPLPMLP